VTLTCLPQLQAIVLPLRRSYRAGQSTIVILQKKCNQNSVLVCTAEKRYIRIADTSLPYPAHGQLKRPFICGQGRDLFVLGLLRAIEAEDWEKVRKYYELTSTAQEGSEKETNGLAIKTSELQRSYATHTVPLYCRTFA
jgi:hypothetical protein